MSTLSKKIKFQIAVVFILLSVGSWGAGYYTGAQGFEFAVRKNPPKIEVTNKFPDDQSVDFSRFWQVWQLVNDSYLQRPVSGQDLLYGAIEGMVDALDDPYTTFLPPSLNQDVNNSLNGIYQGIGAELGIREEQLIVVAPLDGSPAQEAGVRAGDRILEIEGESTAGLSITEAVFLIRGEAGTISTLTLQQPDQEARVVRIKRGVINIESVTWEDKGEGTVYIRVSRFGADTNGDWNKTVKEIGREVSELDSIIVDLRGNPGGYLQSAVHIASDFAPGKVILYQENATGEQIPFKAEDSGDFASVPQVIVLINEGSASASEILAAALKVHSDATIIGRTSFGKGTIQDAQNFEDGSGVHITVAKWLTPNKEWVHDVGITPDEDIELTDDNRQNDEDPQLDRAIELANEI